MNNEELRAAVDRVGREVERVADERDGEEERATAAALTSAWRRLVELLAVAPAPELVSCPNCGRVGMRAATVCGYCWMPLTPRALA